MKINSPTLSFQARNPNVRRADRICRMVNTAAPSVSPSKLITEAILQKDKKMYGIGISLQTKLLSIIRDPGAKYIERNNNPEFYKFFVSALKEAKIANCGEKARLASLICAVNGIETKIVALWTVAMKKLKLGQNLDHAVLVVSPSSERLNCELLKNMNNKIIIDPWLGIADYGNNVNLEYKKYFERFKDVDEQFKNFEEMNLAVFHEETVSNKTTEELRKIFPEFIIDKK